MALTIELQVIVAILETAADADGFRSKNGGLVSSDYLTRRVAVLNEWRNRLMTLKDTGQFPSGGLVSDPGSLLP